MKLTGLFPDGRWYGIAQAEEAKNLHPFHVGSLEQAARNSQARELLDLLRYLRGLHHSGLRTLVFPVLLDSRWLIVRVEEDVPRQPYAAAIVEVLYFTSDPHARSPFDQRSTELNNALDKMTALSYCLHMDGTSCPNHRLEAHHLSQRLVFPAQTRHLSRTTHRIQVLNDLKNDDVHFAYALAAMVQMIEEPQVSMLQVNDTLSRVTVDQLRAFQHRLVEPLHSESLYVKLDLVCLALMELQHVRQSPEPSMPGACDSLRDTEKEVNGATSSR